MFNLKRRLTGKKTDCISTMMKQALRIFHLMLRIMKTSSVSTNVRNFETSSLPVELSNVDRQELINMVAKLKEKVWEPGAITRDSIE